ncbi:efflux RND transporter periplasmic adaptor subunit [Paraburkholderia sp. Cpub6]|uniref:efflux RND transporter periplasmic adaptor subunit n=1 Tax=Paraburkholderia sp. Cpub6 TaxID=2723094 RepID=UPI00161ACAE2|nr:efflux RND transporter periplasmic adaptor subunit [Paraburkholderia sp. Cpub6]MBB5457049.1 cobalt-zinc-cadmium efflux system membrane fusion protein [Paraburkholderia sp. Cpub6]
MKTNYQRRLYASVAGAGLIVLCGAFAIHSRNTRAAAEPVAAESATSAAASSTPTVSSAVDLAPEALSNLHLQIADAALRPGVRTITAPGVIAFNGKQLAQLSSPSRGRIEAVDVAVGEHVRAGQRLAVLDEFDLSDVRSQLASAQAALADATAAADAAHAALARGTELVDAGGIAQSELERRRAMAANADATLRSRQADLQKWRGMTQRLMPIDAGAKAKGDMRTLAALSPRDSLGAVVAPFDGVVTAVSTAAGNIVDTSQSLVTVTDLSTVWLQVSVPEHDAAAVHAGQTVAVNVDAYPNQPFNGRVIDVADQADPNTGTVMVRCEVPNPGGLLRANLFATANIAAPLGHDSVLVPDSALQDVNGRTVVFVPAGQGHFLPRTVHTGVAESGMTEIVSGVAAGTPVVANGSYWLKAALMQTTIPDEG